MFGENAEKIKLPSSRKNEIEKDLLSEVKLSEIEHAEKKGSTETETKTFFEGAEKSGALGGASQILPKSPFPKKVAQLPLVLSSYCLYEKRIKNLPEDRQEEARNIVKPNEEQISACSELFGWLASEFAPQVMESKWFVAGAMVAPIIEVEAKKVVLFQQLEAQAAKVK